LLCALTTTAQTPIETEYYKELWMEQIGGSDSDEESSSLWDERWTERTTHKYNLSTVTRDQLSSLYFLDDTRIEALLTYREKHGAMLTFSELLVIPELSYTDRQLLPLFTYIGDAPSEEPPITLRNLLTGGTHALVLSTDIPLYKRAGYRDSTYEGNALHETFRYQYNYRDKVLWGIQGDKDPGEPFFGSWNKYGYDYYGYYLLLNNVGRIKRMVVGDYRLSFGQGLVMNNNMSFGKSNDILAQNNGKGIQKHSSTGEVDYFEGAAVTLGLGRKEYDDTPWKVTAYVSRRRLDANTNSDGDVTSWKTDGYHRTESEEGKNGTCTEWLYGGHLSYSNRYLQIGATGTHTHYDRALTPSNLYYKEYAMRGSDFSNASVDYAYIRYPLAFRGETAINDKGYMALLHKLSYYVTHKWQLFVSHRYYDKQYTAPHASSIGTNSAVQNEQGVYAGMNWNPTYHTQINGYVDYYHFPSAVYGCRLPSSGMEMFLKADFLPIASTRIMVSYKWINRQKSYDLSDTQTLLHYDAQHRIQLRITTVLGERFTAITSSALTYVKKYETSLDKGWYVAQRLTYTPCPKLRISTLLGYFHTEDYASRIYIFEPTLSYGSSFGSLYGQGIRLALLGSYAPCPRLKIEAKYGLTNYFDRSEISSGNQLISASHKEDISIIVSCKL
jgi:hypothetical protein